MSEPDKLMDMIEANKKITEELIAERDKKIKELTEKNENLAKILVETMELAKPMPPNLESYRGLV